MNWNKIKRAKWFIPLSLALVAVLVFGAVYAANWQSANIHGSGTVVVTTPPPAAASFSATITADSSSIGSVANGTGSATLLIGGVATTTHTLSVTSPAMANIANGNYGFTLQKSPNDNTAALTAYFAAAMAGNSTYITDIGYEINGTQPFFYLNISGTAATISDGFQNQLNSTNFTSPLVINDTYPQGTYTYTGTLNSSDGAPALTVTITLIVSETFTWTINGNTVTTGTTTATVNFATPSDAIGANSSFTAIGTLAVTNTGSTAISGWTLGSPVYPSNITSPNLTVSQTPVSVNGGTATLTFTLTGTAQSTTINFSGVTFTLTPQ
jgi:hypothetical protein